MREEFISSPERMAEKIKRKRDYPGYEILTFLLVEGDTDGKFYKKYIDKNRCQIEISGNKDRAIRTLTILENEKVLLPECPFTLATNFSLFI